MLDPLVDGQDRQVAGAGQAAVVEQRLEAPQDPGRAVAVLPDPVDEVGPRQVKLLFGHGLALVLQEIAGGLSQGLLRAFHDPLVTVAIIASYTFDKPAPQVREYPSVTL